MARKLAVSNIAWEQNLLKEHLELLRKIGCDGVEIAPSCIWKEPTDLLPYELEDFKRLITDRGLTIPAFHALLFTRPELTLFNSRKEREDMLAYLKKLIHLAGKLSVPALVYGSPASRKRDKKDYSECYNIAVEAFSVLAKEAENHNTVFCIEPLGPKESDFVNNAEEGFSLVRDVARPGFGLHLDAKAMVDAKEDFEAVFKNYGGILKHFHCGDPGLAPPGHTGLDHGPIGAALANSQYKGFVSIEMRRGFGPSQKVITDAVTYVREKYRL